MTPCTLFIADLHLNEANTNVTQLFCNFLESLPRAAEAIYILGDLFQFWAGDDDCSNYNQQIKTKLLAVSKHIPIFLMPGNRDFLLGERFARESGCILLNDPSVIYLYGTKTLLVHGDLLCSKDIKYSIFRKIIRLPYGIKFFLKLPLTIRCSLAQQIQKYSARAKLKQGSGCITVASEEVAEFVGKFQVEQIIHGHTHKEIIRDFYLNGQRVRCISLGEWQTKAEVLVYGVDF